MLEGLTRLTGAIHRKAGKSLPNLCTQGVRRIRNYSRKKGRLGPSPVADPLTGRTPKEMTRQEITQPSRHMQQRPPVHREQDSTVSSFTALTGYGINQFLSGASNQRSDAYGGDIGKRYVPRRSYGGRKGAVGRDYPLFIKLSGHDLY